MTIKRIQSPAARTTSVSRDLLLLSAIAYKNQKYDSAGSLFAAAMSAHDSDELISELDSGSTANLEDAEAYELDSSSITAGSTMTLGEIAQALSSSMQEQDDDQNFAEASDDDELPEESDDEQDVDEESDDEESDEVVDEESESDEEPEIEEDEDESDDMDPDAPGQSIVPSSISSSVDYADHTPRSSEKTRPNVSESGEARTYVERGGPQTVSISGTPDVPALTFVSAKSSPVAIR